MGANSSHRRAGRVRIVTLFGLFALALSVAGARGSADDPAPASPAGPVGRSTPESAIDAPTTTAIDASQAWHMPPGEGPRGPGAPLYDNGVPLDDGGDPASQASLQADGASPIWRFIAAAADNFELPQSTTSPGSNYNVTTVRAAFDFFASGAPSATPLTTWTQGVYVTIYAHSPLNQPAGAPALSGGTVTFTGNVVASALVPRSELLNQVEINTGCRIVHQIDIPVNFNLAAETTYWLSIMPRYPAPPQAAWCLTEDMIGIEFDAMRGATFGPQFWTEIEGNLHGAGCSSTAPQGTIKELSFQLFGAEMPSEIGACCNTVSGDCTDVDRALDPDACTAANEVFNAGQTCALLDPACDEGACCYTDQFDVDQCVVTNEEDCLVNLDGHSFTLGEICSPEIDCTSPPDNDNCPGTLIVNGQNVLVEFNSANATEEPTIPDPTCSPVVKDVWYRWQATCTGTVVFTTLGSQFDTVLAIYGNGTNSCPPCPTTNVTLLDCNDDNAFEPSEDYSLLSRSATFGECFLIRIGGKPGASPEGGPGTLRIFCVPDNQGACCRADGSVCTLQLETNCQPPDRWFENEPCGSPSTCLPNDHCVSPAPLPSNDVLTRAFDTTRATQSPGGQPTDCGPIEQDIWFSYVAPCTGEIEITTTGSSYDTMLAVYDFTGGVCPNPAFCSDLATREIACSDDESGNPLARVRLTAVTAGNCYVIRVGGHDNGFDASGGLGVLNIFCIEPNEGACCFEDESPCAIVLAADCAAPNLFFPGQACDPGFCPDSPDNDLCVDAISLPSAAPQTVPFNTEDATTDVDAPLTTCGAIVQDIWYQYIAPCDGSLIISTVGSSFDTSLAVYGEPPICPAACPLPAPDGNFTEIICNNDRTPPELVSQVVVLVTTGDCLLIRVGGHEIGGGGGLGELHLECSPLILGACCHPNQTCDNLVEATACAAVGDQFFPGDVCSITTCPPVAPNDECGGAIEVFNGATPFDTSSATDSLTPVTTCAQPTKDLWYKYTATCNGNVEINLCGATVFDSTIAVYADCLTCPPTGEPFACDNDTCSANGPSLVGFTTTQDACYLIRIGGVAGAAGPGEVVIACTPEGCCPGDADLSGIVDFNDVDDLVTVLLDPIGSEDPAFCAADVNGDGSIDGADIQAFLVALFSGAPCDVPEEGACCLSDDTCIITTSDNCTAQSGTYQGDNTTCVSNPCTVLTGACCQTGGTCTIETSADCSAASGSYLGDGSDCSPDPCTTDTGACCLDDGDCQAELAPACAALGGEFQGPGIPCAAQCTPAPPDCPGTLLSTHTGSDSIAGDFFGSDVAIDGALAVVGAEGALSGVDDFAGAAYVFTRTAGAWSEFDKLTSDTPAADELFGNAVDTSNGRILVAARTAIVGGQIQGAVFSFAQIAGAWTLQQEFSSTSAQPFQQFGFSLAVDGNTAVVGALGDNQNGVNAGAAWVFIHNGASWVLQQKLLGSDTNASDLFGNSVAVSGNLAVVGAPGASTGGFVRGAAYVFERTGTTWTEVDRVTGFPLLDGQQFGTAIDISGDLIVVGDYEARHDGVRTGLAYVFEREGVTWADRQKLAVDGLTAASDFGRAVKLLGESVAVSAPGENAVFTFSRQGNSWIEGSRLDLPGQPGEIGGDRIDWDANTLIAGSELGEFAGSPTGVAHFFDFSCEGGCCLAGNCQLRLEADCLSAGGTFFGMGVECLPDACGVSGCCIGDFSGNSIADPADIADFVNALLNPPTGDPDLCLADADESGTVDGSDVQAFVNALIAADPCGV